MSPVSVQPPASTAPSEARAWHRVRLYESDAALAETVAGWVEGALEAREGALVLATAAHRGAIAARLAARGSAPADRRRGTVEWIDAEEALAHLLVDGRPDPLRFRELVRAGIRRAGGAAPGVRVFGELVAVLWARGARDAALALEALWNEVGRDGGISLLCAYPLAGFGREADREGFLRVCAEHGEIAPAESFGAEAPRGERDRAVAALQQKAAALEAEVRERRRLEAELERRVAELADADRRKDEFLATLAHELRNPLAPIRMAVRLSLARAGSAGGARYLEIVDRQAENLGRIVDDLLDVSRITHGRIELRPERLDVATVVARAVDATRHLVDQRRHHATVTLPTEPVHVLADAVRLEQVLVNLVANAAKYTPPGGHVAIEVEAAEGTVALRVRDTGVGIPPELIGRVFDLFQQAARPLDRSQGGLGIGLTVAKKLVELHGGTIAVRSDGPGAGAEFSVTLPRAAAPELAEAAPPRPAPAGPALRVLVVDDNGDAGEVVAEILREEGHEVRTAVDGRAALALAAAFAPDVVVLDIGLPELDGLEVARRLRAGGCRAALVALSGYGQRRDRALTTAAGFAAHLVKPVQPDALVALLSELAPAGRARGAVAANDPVA